MKHVLFCLLLFTATQVSAQKSYYITSRDHFKLNVNEYGTGKPVILLAGGPGMAASYLDPVWKKLPGIHFVVPDQRGTGKSVLPKIDSTTISVAQYIDDLEVLRIHLKLSKMLIVGHSWGGMLAMAYTAKYPGKVERLILLSSGGATDKFYTYFGDNITMRLTEDEKKNGEITDSNGLISYRAIIPGYFYNREKGIAARKDIIPASFGQEALTIGNIMVKDYALTGKSRTASLKNYRGRVDLLQGRQDPIGETTAFETKTFLKQARISFIEKCGHIPWLEPDEISVIFFDRLKALLK